MVVDKAINMLDPLSRGLVEKAFKTAQQAHSGQKRDDGSDYISHPVSVFEILFSECGIRDANILAASLIHDAGEDSDLFADRRLPHSIWVKEAGKNIADMFNPEVADLTIALSKPNIDGREIAGKAQMQEAYLKGFKSAKAILLKMADRLHNLRDLKTAGEEKRIRYLRETPADYFPLFTRVLDVYPKEGRYLLNQMETILNSHGKL